MSLKKAMPQKSVQMELPLCYQGEARNSRWSVEASKTTNEKGHPGASGLMERILERENLLAALKRVKSNKGSPGIDGMTVDELAGYLMTEWSVIRESLLEGTYRPQPVKRQIIPKPGGGERELGIPTALDRFIQQAVLQVLQPIFDPTFSDHSYGFRPGRSAHQALRRARQYIQDGRRIVVDVDLAKFFDRVNHDILMNRLAKRIEDKRLLKLIRRYLNAGIMANGVVIERHEGTPQGGPLSPLLANLLLDEVDRELEKSGHAFVRYADDLNVYVRSRRAGQRVMERLRKLYGALRLHVNEAKSTIAPATTRKFLGYSFWIGAKWKVYFRVASQALCRMKQRIRWISRHRRGKSIGQVIEGLRSFMIGWKNYFKLANTPKIFSELDAWIRHRLRALQLKQWKRGKTIFRELVARGVKKDQAAMIACYGRRWWHTSCVGLNRVIPNSYFDGLGLPRLAA